MNVLLLTEAIVKIVGYTAVLYGIWRLVGKFFILKAMDLIVRDWKRKRYTKRLNRLNSGGVELERDSAGVFHTHIRTVLLSLHNNKKKGDPTNFYVLSLFLFSVSFMVLFILSGDFIVSMVVGLTMLILPYIFIRFRLVTKRLKTSMLFMENFHLIIQSYNASAKSAYHMISNLTTELDDKELKKVFMKLLASMQQDRDEDEFKESIRVFTYSINSSFAIRFGNLLQKAHLDSADISRPLEDLNVDITNRKNDLEQEKSLNVETKLLGYLSLITLPLFVFAAFQLSKMYSFSALFNQNINLFVFIIAFFFTLFSLFAVIVFSRPRSDV